MVRMMMMMQNVSEWALTGKRVGNIIFDFHIHEESRKCQSLVLLVPQVDVMITCRKKIHMEL